jgi:Fe2+ transport system protein B
MPSPEAIAGTLGAGPLTKDPSENVSALLMDAIDGRHREIASLKELIFTRLDAMDKAVTLFSDNLTRVPTSVDKQVGNLRELHDEHFARVAVQFEGIQLQFIERDTRTEKSAEDSKIAVDAALQAAKEAVGKQQESNSLAIAKSETATTKQIDQINLNVQSINAALNDKIDDVRTRLTTIDGRGQGAFGAWGVLVAVVAAAVGLGGLLISMRGGNSDKSAAQTPSIIYVQPQPQAQAPVVIQPGK